MRSHVCTGLYRSFLDCAAESLAQADFLIDPLVVVVPFGQTLSASFRWPDYVSQHVGLKPDAGLPIE